MWNKTKKNTSLGHHHQESRNLAERKYVFTELRTLQSTKILPLKITIPNILFSFSQHEGKADRTQDLSSPSIKKKKNSTLWYGSIRNTQVTADLVSRRLQDLSNLISIALIKSHLARFLFVVF